MNNIVKCSGHTKKTSPFSELRESWTISWGLQLFPRRLIYNGRTNIQTRGLIVLLLSKAAGHLSARQDSLQEERVAGITQRQRSLAEITEMIHTAHLIHRGVLNLSNDLFPDATTMKDLQFGNKISVLTGDYLIANASKSLTDLKNCKVMYWLSKNFSNTLQSLDIRLFLLTAIHM